MSGSVPGKKSTDDTKKDTVYIGSGTLCLSEIKKTDAKKMVIDGSVTFADCNYMCDDEERVVMPEYDSWFSKCPNVKNIKVTSATYISNDNAWKAEDVNCTFAAGDLYVKNNILMYRYKTQGVFACPIPQKGIVEIPEKTENIYDSAFLKCQKITKVKIPATVKKIGSAAFGYNSAMKKIEVDKSSKYLKTVDGVLYSKDGKILYAYPSGKKDKIFCVPENVCAIADGAFMGASNLPKIILSSKVEYVGVCAFMDCKRLRQVKSKNEIKFMMASAFLNCKKMKKYPQVEGETKVDGRVYFNSENRVVEEEGSTFLIGNET